MTKINVSSKYRRTSQEWAEEAVSPDSDPTFQAIPDPNPFLDPDQFPDPGQNQTFRRTQNNKKKF